METAPIGLFNEWFTAEKVVSTARIPEACCLSTVGSDGFPNARFLALKEVRNGNFVITGPLRSRKGAEILANPKVALTFWWPHTERQVRVQGSASQLPREAAIRYFAERNREAQLVSSLSNQGKKTVMPEALEWQLELAFGKPSGAIPCPDDWGGFAIEPIRIEFLEFAPSRLHRRALFEREGETWNRSYLEP